MALIYEVRIEIDPKILASFEPWLESHMQEVVKAGRFLGATVYTEHDMENIRVVHYLAESYAALELYLKEQAPRLRADAIQQFGSSFRAQRRVLIPCS